MTDTIKPRVDFSLMPASRAALAAFFESRLGDLQKKDPEAQSELQQLIKTTFPVDALDALERIFQGKATTAVLVHNCPEREGVESMEKLSEEDTYSYHIGNALYAMHRKATGQGLLVKRTMQEAKAKAKVVGDEIHRDMLARGEYIIFSSPYNGEQAVTEVIYLQEAIESLPEEVRNKPLFTIVTQYDHIEPCDLNTALKALKEPLFAKGGLKRLIVPANAQGPEVEALAQAIERHRGAYNLQPGSLLVLDEKTMFHRASHGDVSPLPPEQHLTRVLLHNASAQEGPMK